MGGWPEKQALAWAAGVARSTRQSWPRGELPLPPRHHPRAPPETRSGRSLRFDWRMAARRRDPGVRSQTRTPRSRPRPHVSATSSAAVTVGLRRKHASTPLCRPEASSAAGQSPSGSLAARRPGNRLPALASGERSGHVGHRSESGSAGSASAASCSSGSSGKV